MITPYPLFPHQPPAIEYLRRNRRALLTDEMGLGKTVEALMALPPDAAAIVVCPASLKGNWQAEAATWRPDLKAEVLNGRRSFRWPAIGELLIVNYAILPLLAGAHWDLCHPIIAIVDEAHYLKSPKSQRSVKWGKIANLILSEGGATWLMTGTPLVTSPADLWGVLDAANLADGAYGSFWDFAELWGVQRGRFGLEWNPKKIKTGAQDGFDACSFGRKRIDVLKDLPPKRWRTLFVKVPYSCGRLDKGALDEVRMCSDAPNAIERLKALGKLARARKEIALGKCVAAIKLIDDIIEGGGAPLVVFSAHKDPISYLGERSGWERITGGVSPKERTRIVKAFQAGELEGIAGTIGAMGTGLTLTRSHRMIFIDLDWSPAINAQAEDRINRIGQANACEYIRLVADCEVDKIIHAAITRKDQMIYHVDEARKANPA